MTDEKFHVLKIGDLVRFNFNNHIYIRRVKRISEGAVSVFDKEEGFIRLDKHDLCDSILQPGETIEFNGREGVVSEVDGESYFVNGSWYCFTEYGHLTFTVKESTDTEKANEYVVDEKIVHDIEEVLDEAEYPYNLVPLQKMLSTWATGKEKIISILRKHPNWNEENKCIEGEVEEIRDQEDDKFLEACKRFYANCRKNGMYLTDEQLNIMWDSVQCTTPSQFVTDEIKARYAAVGVETKVGEKYSRVLNRVFTSMGLDKYENYNHDFAIIADCINPQSNNRRIVLSVHPCDYLKMSWGENWNSCHDIRSRGCYHAGTQSYMMDSTSMILYTLSNHADPIPWRNNKLTREIFCYEDGTLLQSRLYPDYRQIRRMDIYLEFVKKVFDVCLGVDNNWQTRRYRSDYIITNSGSTHYPDYDYDQYNTRVLTCTENPQKVKIGHSSINLLTGNAHSCHENINYDGNIGHTRNPYQDAYYICAECGETFYTSEGIHYEGYDESNDDWYCHDHFRICEHCGRIFYGDSDEEGEWCNDNWYCEDCRLNHLVECEHCGTLFDPDLEGYRDNDGNYYCEGCYEDAYCCENCGRLEFDRDYVYEHDGDYYCEHCYDELFFECDECGETYDRCDENITDDGSFCPDCFERIRVEETPSEENVYRITNEDLVLLSPAGAYRYGYSQGGFICDNVVGLEGTKAVSYHSGSREVIVLKLKESDKYVAVLANGVEKI